MRAGARGATDVAELRELVTSMSGFGIEARSLATVGRLTPAVSAISPLARMRHKNATTTLNTYGHLWPDKDETARSAVAAAMTNGRSESLLSPRNRCAGMSTFVDFCRLLSTYAGPRPGL